MSSLIDLKGWELYHNLGLNLVYIIVLMTISTLKINNNNFCITPRDRIVKERTHASCRRHIFDLLFSLKKFNFFSKILTKLV